VLGTDGKQLHPFAEGESLFDRPLQSQMGTVGLTKDIRDRTGVTDLPVPALGVTALGQATLHGLLSAKVILIVKATVGAGF
jgi:hypothetical protein